MALSHQSCSFANTTKTQEHLKVMKEDAANIGHSLSIISLFGSMEGYIMDKKFELTTETMQWFGRILHRIKALKGIPEIGVKRGDIGGWVEKEENLSQKGSCWIFRNAKVYGKAKVCGNAIVYGNAELFGLAQIYDGAEIFENALHNAPEEMAVSARRWRSQWKRD